MIFDEFSPSRTRRTLTAGGRTLRALGLDGPLTGVLAIIVCIGILVVYSASGQNWKMVEHHLVNIGIAVAALLALARLATPQYLRLFAPIAYVIGVLLLIVVDVTGHIGKGAQRWLDVGFMRFQPSEIMKLAVPMMCAWYMHERPLPPTFKDLLVMGIMIGIPTAMIVVDVIGHIGKGAQRWLDLGFFTFQPSEIMKLAVPMLCAWYLHERPLPPSISSLSVLAAIILVPVALTAAQPDLGTAILITIAGGLLVVMAGLSVWIIAGAAVEIGRAHV